MQGCKQSSTYTFMSMKNEKKSNHKTAVAVFFPAALLLRQRCPFVAFVVGFQGNETEIEENTHTQI